VSLLYSNHDYITGRILTHDRTGEFLTLHNSVGVWNSASDSDSGVQSMEANLACGDYIERWLPDGSDSPSSALTYMALLL
jgi:hypothetical protein